ncbi:MAG TPA: AmmeMemoRadiSam system protein A [Pilimelia sp.]|nr:AmmeMemoRadiSam system protein A [Pilimelia sp.]
MASSTMPATDGADLARRAADAVAARLAGQPLDGRPPAAVTLRALGATFVTLEATGALLGCIGSIDAGRPIYLDAMHNAVRAAADPRLPPVTPAQWGGVDVKVSVLSRPELLAVANRAELLALLRPGVDGLVLADDRRRATFLPSVWRKVPEPARFISALLAKGGWPRAVRTGCGWPADITVRRYTVVEFTDPAPR